MPQKTINKCIEDILLNIECRKIVDYGDKASVRAYNAAYGIVERNFQYIDLHYPDQISQLLRLCHYEDVAIVSTCAPIILRLQNSTMQQKQEAYSCIEDLVKSGRLDEVSSFGFQMWLQNHEKELKN